MNGREDRDGTDMRRDGLARMALGLTRRGLGSRIGRWADRLYPLREKVDSGAIWKEIRGYLYTLVTRHKNKE